MRFRRGESLIQVESIIALDVALCWAVVQKTDKRDWARKILANEGQVGDWHKHPTKREGSVALLIEVQIEKFTLLDELGLW